VFHFLRLELQWLARKLVDSTISLIYGFKRKKVCINIILMESHCQILNAMSRPRAAPLWSEDVALHGHKVAALELRQAQFLNLENTDQGLKSIINAVIRQYVVKNDSLVSLADNENQNPLKNEPFNKAEKI
jgi:hypothetical protein